MRKSPPPRASMLSQGLEALEERRFFSAALDTGFELAAPLPTTTTASTIPTRVAGQSLVARGGAPLALADADSNALIGVSSFRADARFTGIDGSGYSVAVLDTGIDLNHPFFGADADLNGVADRIVYQYDFADNDADASDRNGHGSNVAGIVAGADAVHSGMAPGASLIALKVFADAGSGQFSYIERALQWVIGNAAAYNIAAVNMSLSDTFNHTSAVQLYGIADEMAALTSMGVVVVSAAGNDYYPRGSVQGVAYPAADPNSLAVSATWDGNSGGVSWGNGAIDYTTAADRVTSFSQRSTTLTDVFAPGAFITGPNASGGTSTFGGTSQAAPHIAGIVALAQDLAGEVLNRRLSVSEFRNLLRSTAVTIVDGDDENDNVTNTGATFPRVDVQRLAEAIYAMAAPAEPSQAPFKGVPFSFGAAGGATIQAEDYDLGGEGFAFHETTAHNVGNVYRPNEAVDVKLIANTTNQYRLSDAAVGEWVEYSILANDTATYELEMRLSNADPNARIHVEIDGVDVTGPIAVPDTNSFSVFQSVRKQFNVAQGAHVLRIAFDTAAVTGSVAGIDWMKLAVPPPPAVATTVVSTVASYVRNGTYASQNFGLGNDLIVKRSGTTGNTREIYLKFDLRSLTTINTAKLRLYGRLSDTGNSSVLTRIYAASNTSWSETGLTWNNKPASGTTVRGSFTVAGTTAKWYEIDLSTFLKSEFAAGRKVVTLVLKNPNTSNAQTLLSSDETANGPRLVVT